MFKCILIRISSIPAAHCVRNKGDKETRKVQEVKIRLGAYDLTNDFESGSVAVSPYKIVVHSDWNPLAASFDADIAMLVVDSEVFQYTKYIKPICLFNPTDNSSGIDDGVVVGWGLHDSGPSNITAPQQLRVSIVPNARCFLKNPHLVPISSERTFCAGFSDANVGVCNGDSGGGLFVRFRGRYFLFGTVSASLLSAGNCDVDTYAIYTDAQKMSPWIDSQTSNFDQSDFDQRLHTPPPTKPPKRKYTANSCGIMEQDPEPAMPLEGASIANKYQWPWLSVIKRTPPAGNVSYVTGTIITSKHILSFTSLTIAEVNKQNQWVPRDAKDFLIYVGITALAEILTARNSFRVQRIVINPNFERGVIGKGNVVVIVLENYLQFSTTIRPVCLGSSHPVELSNGYLVGYAALIRGSKIYGRIKKHLALHAAQCPMDYKMLMSLSPSMNYFCLTGEAESYQCASSSLLLFIQRDGVWYAKGLIVFIPYQGDEVCSMKFPYMIEDLTVYNSWIYSEVKKDI